MKRKLLNILLALFLCAICIFSLTGCGEEKTNSEEQTANAENSNNELLLNPELEGTYSFASKKIVMEIIA